MQKCKSRLTIYVAEEMLLLIKSSLTSGKQFVTNKEENTLRIRSDGQILLDPTLKATHAKQTK